MGGHRKNVVNQTIKKLSEGRKKEKKRLNRFIPSTTKLVKLSPT